MPDDEPRDKPSPWGQLLRFSALGLEMGFTVLGGLALGYYADRYFGTSPWLTVVGLTAGFAGGLWTLIRLVKILMESETGSEDR